MCLIREGVCLCDEMSALTFTVFHVSELGTLEWRSSREGGSDLPLRLTSGRPCLMNGACIHRSSLDHCLSPC